MFKLKKSCKRKPFSQKLYNRYDSSGKQFAKDLIDELNRRQVIIPDENYGVDILLKHPSLASLDRHVETQTITAWGDVEYPYQSFHIPKAKVDRLMEIYGDDIYFMAINNAKTRCLMVKASKFLRMKEISKKNRYSPLVPEIFYDVDLELCEFYFI